MLIDIRGHWINPDHIIRLTTNDNGNVLIVLRDKEGVIVPSRESVDEIAGLIIRSTKQG